MAAQTVTASVAVHESAEPRGFLRRYVFSMDHKVIGIQYIITGLLMALLGAGLATLIRLQLGWPDHAWPLLAKLLPEGYQSGVMAPEFYLARGDDARHHHGVLLHFATCS